MAVDVQGRAITDQTAEAGGGRRTSRGDRRVTRTNGSRETKCLDAVCLAGDGEISTRRAAEGGDAGEGGAGRTAQGGDTGSNRRYILATAGEIDGGGEITNTCGRLRTGRPEVKGGIAASVSDDVTG